MAKVVPFYSDRFGNHRPVKTNWVNDCFPPNELMLAEDVEEF